MGGFVGGTPTNFHAADGRGYEFLGDTVLALDKLNGSVAARMVGGFVRWRKYDEVRANDGARRASSRVGDYGAMYLHRQ